MATWLSCRLALVGSIATGMSLSATEACSLYGDLGQKGAKSNCNDICDVGIILASQERFTMDRPLVFPSKGSVMPAMRTAVAVFLHRAARASAAVILGLAGSAIADECFTMALWIRPAAPSPDAPIVVCTTDATNRTDGFGLFLDPDGSLRGYARSAGDAANVVPGPIPAEGEWSHLCLAYDGAHTFLYLNGALQGVATNDSGSADVEADFYIGDDGFRAFDGEISDIDLYDEALSDADVSRISNGEEPDAAAGECDAAPPDSVADEAVQSPPALSGEPGKGAPPESRPTGKAAIRRRKVSRRMLKVHSPLE